MKTEWRLVECGCCIETDNGPNTEPLVVNGWAVKIHDPVLQCTQLWYPSEYRDVVERRCAKFHAVYGATVVPVEIRELREEFHAE